MNSSLRIPLNASPEQAERLRSLQAAFAQVCNVLAPIVQERRLWHRVTLHHLTYHQLREQFPALGSQMVCNAIYAVCRAARMVYQHPDSPFNAARLKDSALPLLSFAPSCPVYFDRHTLSLKAGQLSMYTLDGRMRFQLYLRPEDESRFRQDRVREIVLTRAGTGFELVFTFAQEAGEAAAPARLPAAAENGVVPNSVQVEERA
jgi:hypothetical protein